MLNENGYIQKLKWALTYFSQFWFDYFGLESPQIFHVISLSQMCLAENNFEILDFHKFKETQHKELVFTIFFSHIWELLLVSELKFVKFIEDSRCWWKIWSVKYYGPVPQLWHALHELKIELIMTRALWINFTHPYYISINKS